ncbi:DNA-processing protein DprA [uncultured Oscillibacter sp.]|uniref:DNA-processing protein DprA n=1 Tax=uncultured Oscillibacter sp. TaxID=876091 RepID=UPI0025ED625B|nr:DNA-processing protein DprA [uncultured Oscillibacter sp.]
MLKYWVWLAELPGVQNQARLALLRHFGSPEDIFFADREELLLAEDVPPAQAERALNRDLSAANRILADCQRLGQRILTIQDAEYPQRLRNIYDPPVLLYVRGRLPAFDEEAAVAVVGTRECTPYGRACAERLGWGLASGGALVVTGLAKGVDASAARGALRAGGAVVGVTGNGLDVYYPYENRELYDDVAAAGALLSEYPPGTEADGWHFPVRNRILSGLSVAALVVEAPERSGALITARLALEQGRDVYAVPGPIDAPDSVGCNRLIRDGAGLAAEAGDILRDYKARFPDKLRIREAAWTPAPGRRRTPPLSEPAAPEPEDAGPEKPEAPPPVSPSGLTDDQIALLRILDPEKPAQVDDLIADTGVPARRVSSALTMLEIDGMVCQHSGKRYTRTVTLAE